VIHNRESDKAMIFRPVRPRLRCFEPLCGIGTVEPGRWWMPNFMAIGSLTLRSGKTRFQPNDVIERL
jgi:hypothetical protein